MVPTPTQKKKSCLPMRDYNTLIILSIQVVIPSDKILKQEMKDGGSVSYFDMLRQLELVY